MFKRNKIEVVPAMTEFAYEEEKAKYKYATRTEVAVATAIPVVASVGFAAHQYSLLNNLTPLSVNGELGAQSHATIPTGFIADTSLNALANILDPVIQILVAISFPIASVIMIGACFFFMFGNSDKAWSMILNAGLGYVLIQLSPLFLDILKTVGASV
ncbi:hypothetical protein [Ureibacillus sinduriensis]|uniref:hypothetical protein n=1 Tax=Ureibacillus sinduriensis TaxID=561440 RepID=UPI00055C8253|nr:hypothetical protein [Ureibacillus sinduriensis]